MLIKNNYIGIFQHITMYALIYIVRNILILQIRAVGSPDNRKSG